MILFSKSYFNQSGFHKTDYLVQLVWESIFIYFCKRKYSNQFRAGYKFDRLKQTWGKQVTQRSYQNKKFQSVPISVEQQTVQREVCRSWPQAKWISDTHMCFIFTSPPTSVGDVAAQLLLHNILIQEEEKIDSTWQKISNMKSLNTVWTFIKLVGVSLGTSKWGKYEYAVTA